MMIVFYMQRSPIGCLTHSVLSIYFDAINMVKDVKITSVYFESLFGIGIGKIILCFLLIKFNLVQQSNFDCVKKVNGVAEKSVLNTFLKDY